MNNALNALLNRAVLNWRSTCIGLTFAGIQVLTAAKNAHGRDKTEVWLAVAMALYSVLVKDK